MLGIGAIEIEEATYSLGMCGHIVLQINNSGKRYRINHSMSDGWRVSESDDREWTEPRRMSTDDFIALLPPDRGWTYATFIGVWAGFAAGYEKGIDKGKYQERERQRAVPCSA